MAEVFGRRKHSPHGQKNKENEEEIQVHNPFQENIPIDQMTSH
jgi:hypothetical protein